MCNIFTYSNGWSSWCLQTSNSIELNNRRLVYQVPQSHRISGNRIILSGQFYRIRCRSDISMMKNLLVPVSRLYPPRPLLPQDPPQSWLEALSGDPDPWCYLRADHVPALVYLRAQRPIKEKDSSIFLSINKRYRRRLFC